MEATAVIPAGIKITMSLTDQKELPMLESKQIMLPVVSTEDFLGFFRHFRGIMAMSLFEAYFDDSGSHKESDFCVVAGAISDRDTWDRLSSDWNDVLSRSGVSVFHASDFFAGRREFAGWDDSKRDAFSGELLRVIGSARPIICGAGVRREVFEEAKTDIPNCGFDNIHVCIYQCIACVSQQAIDNNLSPTAVVFEHKRGMRFPFFDYFEKLLDDEYWQDRLKIGGVSVFRKGIARPLEVADFIAHRLYRYQANAKSYRDTKEADMSRRFFASFDIGESGILSVDATRVILKTLCG